MTWAFLEQVSKSVLVYEILFDIEKLEHSPSLASTELWQLSTYLHVLLLCTYTVGIFYPEGCKVTGSAALFIRPQRKLLLHSKLGGFHDE